MKKIIVLVLGLSLVAASCNRTPEERNDDIIRETKKCEEAGLRADPYYDLNGVTAGVICEPKQ